MREHDLRSAETGMKEEMSSNAFRLLTRLAEPCYAIERELTKVPLVHPPFSLTPL